ncbi:MAG: hypothetical protein HC897_07705 [Thermoanaerobaculia bacterium]|nr:hypothetical protein [Thermoanaerobaculia bacterium]
MEEPEREAFILYLIDGLRRRDSWCGETHVQKTVFFLQELDGIDLGFNYILYKYGPFSFDLRDQLSYLRADRLIELDIQEPYGPRFRLTDSGRRVVSRYSSSLEPSRAALEGAADRLASDNVATLERYATALYLWRHWQQETPTSSEVVKRLVEVKPHVSHEQAKDAVEKVQAWVAEKGSARVAA